jgi:hypothetical protein
MLNDKEIPPDVFIPCFPGAYYRKAVSSFDEWTGISGIVILDAFSNIIVCDYNHCIRSIGTTGVGTTFVGQMKTACINGKGCTASQMVIATGGPLSSKFFQPCGKAINKTTPEIYITEYG